VEQQFPQVKIIANTENLGFACGNNFLVQHAEGNWLCLLNADTYLLDDAISQLHRSSKSIENLGAIGGRARRPSGVRDPGSRQFFPSLVRLSIVALGGARYLNGALPENARAAGEVETLSGAFMMVPKKVWAEMGGLDEGFFAYAEEMDLCYRIRSKGYRICMDPKAELVHLGVGGAPRAETTVMKTKSMMRFIRKHWGKARSQAACWVIWLHGVVRLVSGMELRFMSPRKGKELVAAFQPIVINPSLWRDG
jgi:GT2 family glycosyltransferase